MDVRYFGTVVKNLKRAKFRLVWIDHKDGRPMFSRGREKHVRAWVGREALSDVICTGLELDKSGVLTAASRKRLAEALRSRKQEKMTHMCLAFWHTVRKSQDCLIK